MTDHIHLFKPGQSVTFTAGADIVGGSPVEVSGDREVVTAAAASAKFVGVAGFDVKDGDDVLVLRGGVQKLIASGTIAAGSRVDVAAGGKVASSAAGAGIGLALTTAADGSFAQIALD